MTKTTARNQILSASFRDPSGFLFTYQGTLFRQINQVYAEDYTRLMETGLYAKLVKAGLLVPHREVEASQAGQSLAEKGESHPRESQAFRFIQPERIPFISYTYEWSYGQLKDAALATLSIQKRALKMGMSLKDASAYNIQFFHGRPTLIDTLSFENYREGEPWVAYRQFCQHFLAPLALMAYQDVRLSQLLRIYIDGIPLDLASRLLPARTRLNFGLYTHIHLHASAQRKYAEVRLQEVRRGRTMSRQALLGLIESLISTVRKLAWKPSGTEWADYYEATNYSEAGFAHKMNLVGDWLARIKPSLVWDLGANTGVFSRQAVKNGAYCVGGDIDPAAVERNYRQIKADKEDRLLPLVIDLTNPSPALGWQNQERASWIERGPADAVLALALIHHLAISNNVPLARIADFLAGLGEWLIIEFIPKTDSQVEKLLRSRKDIFDEYTREDFERIFQGRYDVQASSDLRNSERRVYLMRRK